MVRLPEKDALSEKAGLWVICCGYVAVLAILATVLPRIFSYGLFVGCWTALFALYLIAARIVVRSDDKDALFPLIFGLAVILRLPMLGSEPFLSDDLYRYVWDGHVWANGINPFAYAPDAPQLAHLRTLWHGQINHPEVPTVYPPLAQGLFRALAMLSPGVLASKALWTLADLACIPLIASLCKSRGLSRSHAIVYAFHPLAVLESSSSGHIDFAAIFFLLVAIRLYAAGKETAGHLGLTASILVKFLPLVLVPVVWARSKGKARVGLILVVVVLAYLPLIDAGRNLFAAMTNYGQHWYFNASVFFLASRIITDPIHARILMGVCFLGVIGYCVYRRYPIERAAFVVIVAWLLLTTTVHPWYLLWLLPFLCFSSGLALRYWTWSVGLTYAAKFSLVQTGVWREPFWVWLIQYVPVGVLLIVDLWRGRRDAGPTTAI